MTVKWTDPLPLSDYLQSVRGPGLYVIGESPHGVAPSPPTDDDKFLGENWPDNFHPHYAGISLSPKRGMTSRLYCHARSRGNSYIASLIQKKANLYFIQLPGRMNADLEQHMIMLKSSIVFLGNVRDEESRLIKRWQKQLDIDMPNWREYGRHLEDPEYDQRREG
ncbi:hypothetical protein E8K88_16440 [Lampropedia aestuarii]|uniref:Uncharacterized protein n=1 Tax=Lampropedia aestuarii TaxID=2562762 RepID=A0A4S5BF68_9BURK|nr:hypothetical protein [Lampropedia aestuarii]THJ30954.1 hypothetical protein E8K88_16440 [Lampropedia aestuarii]